MFFFVDFVFPFFFVSSHKLSISFVIDNYRTCFAIIAHIIASIAEYDIGLTVLKVHK